MQKALLIAVLLILQLEVGSASQSNEETAESGWSIEQDIDSKDKPVTYIGVGAARVRGGDQPVFLTVVCRSNGVDLLSSWNVELGYDQDVSFPQLRALKNVYVSLGSQAVTKQEWMVTGSHAFSQEPFNLLRAMLDVDRLTLQIRPTNRSALLITARFDTAGLREALESSSGSCLRALSAS